MSPDPLVRLEVLGGFRLLVGDVPKKLRTRRTEELLAYLALHPAKHSREALADLFWGEGETARQKLRIALSNIRSAVNTHLVTHGDLVWVEGVVVDAHEAIEHPKGDEAEPLPQTLDDWAHAYRRNFEVAILDGLEKLAKAYEQERQFSEAVKLRFRIYDLDPRNDQNHTRLLNGLQRLGRRQEIQRHLQKLSAIPPDFIEFAQSTSAGIALPTDSFVGREVELESLTEALLGDEEPAWVTLVGPPGIGKTRLAKELSRLAPAMDLGVDWISLQECASAEDVRVRLCGEILGETKPLSHPTIAERMVARPPQLLILDNAEHIDPAELTSLLDSLLAPGSSARLLVTSQRALGSTRERVEKVGPLGSGSRGEALAPQEQLFMARARDFLPPTSSIGDHLNLVRQVCAKLEGMPLAIEVAAATLRHVSLADLSAGIGQGSRVSMGRTMRAAVDWSVRLLEADVRETLFASALFRGSFRAVTLGHAVERDASEDLRVLEERSLLSRATEFRDVRYRLLEPVREALDLGEAKSQRERISNAFVSELIELGGNGHAELRQKLLPDFSAIDDSLELLREQRRWDLLAEASTGLAILWSGERPAPHGEALLEEIFQALPDSSRREKSRVANARGHLAYFRHEPAVAKAWWITRLELVEPQAERRTWAGAKCNLGLAELELGRFGLAVGPLNEAHEIFLEEGLPRQLVTTAINLAGAHLGLGSLQAATEWAQEAVDRASDEESLAPWLVMSSLRYAEVSFADENYELAALWASRAYELSATLQDRLRRVESAHRWTLAAFLSGDSKSAVAALSQLVRETIAQPGDTAMALTCEAAAAIADDPQESLRLLGACAKFRQRRPSLIYPSIRQVEQSFFLRKLGEDMQSRPEFRIGRTMTLKEALDLAKRIGETDV